MFIKELYSFNKALCSALLLFIGAFMFINYKQGAVAAPVYQYGMFSEKFHLKDTFTVFRVFVNGEPAGLHRYQFPQRDILAGMPEYYERSEKTNHAVFQAMKNVSDHVSMGNFLKPKLYTNNISDSAYFQWYKITANSIFNTQTENIEVFTQKYIWDIDSLKPVSSPAKILYSDSY